MSTSSPSSLRQRQVPADEHRCFWQQVHALPASLRADQAWFAAVTEAVSQQLQKRQVPLEILEALDDVMQPDQLAALIYGMKVQASFGVEGVPVAVLQRLPEPALAALASSFRTLLGRYGLSSSFLESPLRQGHSQAVRRALA